MPEPRLEGVVFDLDGVLVDSIAVMRAAFERSHRLVVGEGEAPFEVYLSHLGRHMPDTLKIMGLPAEMYDTFVVESRKLVHLVNPCPGASDLLLRLRNAKISTAIATGKTRDRAMEVLATTGLLELVDAVVGSDEVANGKPAPDIVLLALEKIRVTAANAVMIGDSPLDLQAGQAAGTRVAAALWGQASPRELLECKADMWASNCTEFGRLLFPPAQD
jgi:AHBA synthesis associated protein